MSIAMLRSLHKDQSIQLFTVFGRCEIAYRMAYKSQPRVKYKESGNIGPTNAMNRTIY